jgi:hypothetical protein
MLTREWNGRGITTAPATTAPAATPTALGAGTHTTILTGTMPIPPHFTTPLSSHVVFSSLSQMSTLLFPYFSFLNCIGGALEQWALSCRTGLRRESNGSWLVDADLMKTNSNGSYYYSNSNGSTYYNNGQGESRYTPSSRK